MVQATLFYSAAALLLASSAQALESVTNWGGANPSNLKLDVYVPRNKAANPALILALHPCGGSGQQYSQQADYSQAAEQKGFIVAYPSATNDSNCWDVSSARALKHEGGGDPTTLNNMVKYLVGKYNVDKTKVFATGSSSGCMMTNVLSATYPDVFAAATCYSGVAAGCLIGSPGNSPSSSDRTCANGKINKTGAEWAKIVRAMYPGYSGAYPRMMTFHGTADNLVFPANLNEQLKEWSTLLNVQFTTNSTNDPSGGYTKMVYGDGSKLIGYLAQNVGHTVPVHKDLDLKWFGI
ncbi:PHB depolymerase family esterase [Apiospora kogelbergensis]|uniref:Carboxylic ester hydrolase n=1 Tax=Apiospora kogelbergensis TaxID=1337665 RepID=A0AAW0REQ9_9PEZI